MSKYLIAALVLLALVSPVSAANNTGSGNNQGNNQANTPAMAPAATPKATVSPSPKSSTLPSPTGNQVKNQVQTKNMSEETQLKVQTSTALESSAGVGEAVNSLISMPEKTGGIGSEAKVIAESQQKSQPELDAQLSKLESRSSVMTKLFGADRKAIKELKQIKEQNQVRIQALEQLKSKTANKGELDQLQLTIDAMVKQNTELADQIGVAENTPSLFGWMFRIFGLQ